MPAGKIAKIRTRRELAGDAGRGRAGRRPLGRHHARPRTVRRARRRHRPCRRQPARHAADPRADFLAARQAAADGRSILVRLGTRESPRHRGRDREGGRSRRTLERRDQGDRAQPCRRDRHLAGAADRGRSLYRQSAHRTAGDRGQRPHCRRRPGAVGRCRTARRSGRHRAGGIRAASRRALGALSPQRRGGLADRPAGLRQIDAGARAGAPAVRQWRLADPARRRHAARRPQRRSRLLARRTAAKTSAGWPKSRPIWRATATSPSSPRSRRRAEDRAAARRIADTAFREIYVATPAEVCESRDPKGHYAKARAGALPASPASATTTSRRPHANWRSTPRRARSPRRPTRSSGCWPRPAFCSTNWSISPPISERCRPAFAMGNTSAAKGLLIDPALGLKGPPNAALCGRFLLFFP